MEFLPFKGGGNLKLCDEFQVGRGQIIPKQERNFGKSEGLKYLRGVCADV